MTVRNVCGAVALAPLGTGRPGSSARDRPGGSAHHCRAWSRATPGGARVGVGYLVIENRGPHRPARPRVRRSASAEVHETVTEAGVARMRPVDAVVIAPNGRLEFKPGGYHLMLSGLTRPLKEGERFAATLVFERAGRVVVTLRCAASERRRTTTERPDRSDRVLHEFRGQAARRIRTEPPRTTHRSGR